MLAPTKFDYLPGRHDILSHDGVKMSVVIYQGFETLRTFGDNGNLTGKALEDYKELLRTGARELDYPRPPKG